MIQPPRFTALVTVRFDPSDFMLNDVMFYFLKLGIDLLSPWICHLIMYIRHRHLQLSPNSFFLSSLRT